MKLMSITMLLLAAAIAVVAAERGPGCPSGDETPKPTPTTPTPTTATPTTPAPPIGYTLRFTETSTDKFVDVNPALFVCYAIGSCFTAGAWGDTGTLSIDGSNAQYLVTFESSDCELDTFSGAVRPRNTLFTAFHMKSFAMIPAEWTSVENLTTPYRVGFCE